MVYDPPSYFSKQSSGPFQSIEYSYRIDDRKGYGMKSELSIRIVCQEGREYRNLRFGYTINGTYDYQKWRQSIPIYFAGAKTVIYFQETFGKLGRAITKQKQYIGFIHNVSQDTPELCARLIYFMRQIKIIMGHASHPPLIPERLYKDNSYAHVAYSIQQACALGIRADGCV